MAKNAKKNKVDAKAVKVKNKKKNTKITKNQGKKNTYSTEAVNEALDAIKKGQSIGSTAKKYNIPKTTLFCKLKGKYAIECKRGAPTSLKKEQEDDIIKWILYCAERGFPVTKQHLLDTVHAYLKNIGKSNLFKNGRPGNKWYCSFLKRHPNVSVRSAQNLTATRANVSESNLKDWFTKLELYLKENNLLDLPPSRIFNLDESAFMLVPPNNNTVLAEKGSRSVYKLVSGNEKSNLTVLFTVSAAGVLLPPMILFNVKSIPRQAVLEKIPKDWAVGNTEKGWMTADSFFKYMKNVFYEWLVKNNYDFPVIVYADNHSSHFTLELVNFCIEKQIILLGLYPNATHIIQPLDVSLFHVLKDQYKKCNETWRLDNGKVEIKKADFAPILKKALDSKDYSTCIINGFKTCGLFPFNPNAVNFNILNKKPKTQKRVIEPVDAPITNHINDDNKKCLDMLENLLSPDVLDKFRNHSVESHWTGDVSQEALFETWKKLKLMSVENVNSQENMEESPIDCSSIGTDNINILIDKDVNLQDVDFSDRSLYVYETNFQNLDMHSLEMESFNTCGVNELVVRENASVNNFTNPNMLLDQITQDFHGTDRVLHHDYPSQNTNIPVTETISTQSATRNDCIPTVKDTLSVSHPVQFTQDNDIPITEVICEKRITSNGFIPLTEENAVQSIDDVFENNCSFTESICMNNSALDLSVSNKSKESSREFNENVSYDSYQDLDISNDLKKSAKIPQFKQKCKSKPFEVVVNTVDHVLNKLKAKENKKILKENQILLNKQRKAVIKAVKEENQNIAKNIQGRKKLLSKNKIDLNCRLKILKKSLKKENDEEKAFKLTKEVHTLTEQLKVIEEDVCKLDIEMLQTKLQIKQEKL